MSLLLAAEPSRLPLGTLLVRDGLISTEQLEYALAEKEQTGRRLGEIFVSLGWVATGELARLLAEQHGLQYIDLTTADVDPGALSLLPEKYARRYEALPIRLPHGGSRARRGRRPDERRRLRRPAPSDRAQRTARGCRRNRARGADRPRALPRSACRSRSVPRRARGDRRHPRGRGDDRARDQPRQLAHRPRDRRGSLRSPLRAAGEAAGRAHPRRRRHAQPGRRSRRRCSRR